MTSATYKSAGVDLDLYEDAMARLPKLMHRTFSPRVIKLDGGFAGLFRLDFANKIFARNYQKPVLVSCTDGVGTKLKVAQAAGVHHTVGIDLVAMSVNDAICCGAEPLFFLDYVAMSHDDPPTLEQLVRGVSDGCVDADCALLGGETAIMPDIYRRGEYDLAGFCVGVVEEDRVLTGRAIAPGDVAIGVASSGLHSNGFSLVRKVVFEMAKLGIDQEVPELGGTVGQVLLTPTRIYAKPVRQLLTNPATADAVHGIAHITGGGLHENLERIVPEGCRVLIDRGSWKTPPVFPWLQRLGNIDGDEMTRVFNMGIGLVLVVAASAVDTAQSTLRDCGCESWPIGRVTSGDRAVVWA